MGSFEATSGGSNHSNMQSEIGRGLYIFLNVNRVPSYRFSTCHRMFICFATRKHINELVPPRMVPKNWLMATDG